MLVLVTQNSKNYQKQNYCHLGSEYVNNALSIGKSEKSNAIDLSIRTFTNDWTTEAWELSK